jgi:hypothetical protein
MKRSFRQSTGVAVLIALGVLAAAVAPARAVYEPLSSGSTKILLDKSFLGDLKSQGVSLRALPPARLGGSTVSFPVIGGKLDPTTARGEVDHEGALVFTAGRRSVPLKDLQLKTTRKGSPLAAKVGGSQLKLATATSLRFARSGFASRISVSGLALSAKLATRLAKKLDRRGLFEAGVTLGRATTRANSETIAIEQRGNAELTLAPGFQANLNSLFVAVNPVFPAEHPGPFTLPLFAGTISAAANQGTIETQGALEFLQLGGGQIFWREPWIDLAAATFSPEAEILPSPPYAGLGERAPTASFLATSSKADAKARGVSFAGALQLDAATANTFNEVFAKPLGRDGVFVSGEAMGSISFTAMGQ